MQIRVEQWAENSFAATTVPFQITAYSDTFDGAVCKVKHKVASVFRDDNERKGLQR